MLSAPLLAIAAGALAPMWAWHAWSSANSIPFWVLIGPLVVAGLFIVQVRFGVAISDFTLDSIPVVAGLFVVAPRWLLLAVLIATAMTQVLQRVRVPVALFNISIAAIGTSTAIAVFRGVAGTGGTLSLRAWCAAGLASVAYAMVSLCSVAIAWRARGNKPLDEIWRTAVVGIVAEAANATVAFLGVRLIVLDPWLGIPVGVVAGFMGLAYRNYAQLLASHESMERLYLSTREIERPRGHRASIQALLDQTLDLLTGDTAELALLPTDEHPAIVLVSGRDRFFEELPAEAANRVALDRREELLEAAEIDTPDVEVDETFAGFDEVAAAQLKRQVITAPLSSPTGLVGSLRVSMNYGTTFCEADRHLLEMFANHASVALHNSRLIDQLRAEVAEREHQALHDDLTSLPNRVMFDLQTRQALDRRADDELVAVILVDLDRFKEVNDTLGHDRGDELLERLGSRVNELGIARQLTVARLGGDEFAVLLRTAADIDEVRSLAAAVRVALETPIEIAGVIVDVRASLGVAVAPEDGNDATTLLQRADVAMYIAKSDHQGVAFYEPQTDPYSPERLSLAADLRLAVARGEVEPHFQPVTSLVTGEPISVEALARWTHPGFGVVPPDVFIPIAEQSGLIRELTYLMLDRSLDEVRKLNNAGFELRVAVNLSVRLLLDDDLVRNIERHLTRAGVEPNVLTLEVTEGTIMSDPDRAIAVLDQLHALGVGLSIDDFGMGYSSLNLLKRMPVSQLKIDRSFVTALPKDHDDAVIVQSVISLGHNLGMQVVAEGVEELASLEYLRAQGCDSVQGFYLSVPLPSAELWRWLRRRPHFSPAVVSSH